MIPAEGGEEQSRIDGEGGLWRPRNSALRSGVSGLTCEVALLALK